MGIVQKIKTFCRVVYGCSILVIVGSAVTGAAYVGGYLPETVRIEEIEKIIHVPEPEPTLEEALKEVEAFGIEEEVGRVLLEQEDAGRYRKNAIRCEWGSQEWLQIATKLEPKDKAQRDALRCSYGPFQVAGWHAPTYGMVWSDLLDIRNNAQVAAAVWAKCRDAAKRAAPKARKWQIYRSAFRCYNGSGPKAEQYADSAMSKLEQIAFERTFGERM